MRTFSRSALAAVIGMLLLTGTASAHFGAHGHQWGHSHPAYVASGTLVSWSADKVVDGQASSRDDQDGATETSQEFHGCGDGSSGRTQSVGTEDRESGTITVLVRSSNKHARSDAGREVTYTLDDSQVRFSHDETQPEPGELVKVIGKVDRDGRVSVQRVYLHRQ